MGWTKIEDEKSRRRVRQEWKQRPAVCGSDVVGSVNLCGGVSVEAVWCVKRSECPRRFPGWMVVWVWLSLVRPVSRRTHVVLTSAYLGREVCVGKGKGREARVGTDGIWCLEAVSALLTEKLMTCGVLVVISVLFQHRQSIVRRFSCNKLLRRCPKWGTVAWINIYSYSLHCGLVRLGAASF